MLTKSSFKFRLDVLRTNEHNSVCFYWLFLQSLQKQFGIKL